MLAMIAFSVATVDAGERETFDFGWMFKHYGETSGGQAPAGVVFDAEGEGFRKVQLPHDWAIESDFLLEEPNETGKLPWTGYGWYRKEFAVPASFDAEKERYYLDFDGVMSHPKVYVNGKLAGEWAYGYNSFRVDMTRYLEAGKKNVVAVQASNKPLSTRWYPGAGIYRHVWLEKCAPVHVAKWGVYVTTPKVTASEATVVIRTMVVNTSDKPKVVVVKQRLTGKKVSPVKPVKVKLAAGESKEVKQGLVLENPRLWSCESPRMYTLRTTVEEADGEELDRCYNKFGVRRAEWKTDGFFLNGKRVELKGVCEHHDLGALGAAFHARAYERKIKILKEMGCNSIRMTHNPPAPEVLDLCDKHGILVIDELFDIWKMQKYDKRHGYHVDWPQWWKKDVSNFIRRDRNHPCVIAWSGGNEVPEINNPQGVAISRGLRDEIRKYDATRPYTVGCNSDSAMNNGFADTMEVFGYNYRPHLYKKFRQTRPKQPFYASETCSCVGTRDTYFFPLGWKVGYGARNYQVSAYGISAPGWGNCPDVEFTAQKKNPDVAGEYVWTGFDYLGEPTPYNQDRTIEANLTDMAEEERAAVRELMEKVGKNTPSRSSYFGIIDLAGFPKDTYYLYQSRWLPRKKQAHLLPHWNWPNRKGQVTPVMVFSSGDEAELFLNGKSLGVRRRGQAGNNFEQRFHQVGKNDYRFVWEDVVYEPGTLKVVVKKDGKAWATATRVTSGPVASVKADVDRDSILGDGRDLSFVSLELQDAKGNFVPTDDRKVNFKISGAAEMVGFCNGDPTDLTCMQKPNQRFFRGRVLAIVRGKREAAGDAELTVQAEGLPEIKIPIVVRKAKPAQLKR